MCGLVGLISYSKNGFWQSEIKAFGQMLYADAVRGEDGTGVFYNNKKGKPKIHSLKAAIPSADFLYLKEYETVEKSLFKDSNFIIGHNRAATKGKINNDCTHPFHEKHITLVHNGTLRDHADLNKESEVDSHAICVSIAEKGYKETLKKIRGAFALIWFDSKENKLKFCRNSERPLFIIQCSNCTILASEEDMATWIAKRNSLGVKEVTPVKTETVYSIHMDKLEEIKEEKVEYYKAPVTQFHNYKYNYGGHTFKDSSPVKYTKYAFGERIRVKFAYSIYEIKGKGTFYIEADILKYPKIPQAYLQYSDWENKYRCRFFGTRKDLDKLKGKNNLTGKIVQTWQNKDMIYSEHIIEDLQEYVEPPVPMIVNKTKDNPELFECELCGKDTPVKEKVLHDGLALCTSCSIYENYNTNNIWTNPELH